MKSHKTALFLRRLLARVANIVTLMFFWAVVVTVITVSGTVITVLDTVMLRKFFYASALAILLCASPASAITESAFVEKVLAQDKLLEEAEIGLEIKQIELDASRDNYDDWHFELSADAGYDRTNDRQLRYKRSDGSISLSTHSRVSKDADYSVALDVDKRFLSNPSSVSFGLSRDYVQVRNLRYGYDRTDKIFEDRGEQRYGGYTSNAYVEYDYPLLKHDGNAESLKSFRRNIYDLQDQKLSYLETKENFLSARLEDYLLWIFYHRRVNIHNDLLLALRLLTPADDAEAALLSSIIAQTEKAKRDDDNRRRAVVERLAVLLDDAALINEVPTFDLQQRAKLLTVSASDYFARHSRVLKRIEIDMQLNDLEVNYQRNRLLPSLDLTVRLDKELDAAGTSSLIYDDDTTDFKASLEFLYPLGGGISTKAELAKRALAQRRLEIIYAERLENLEGDLQRLTRLLELPPENIVSAVNAAKQSTRLENEKYQQTRAGIRDLVQAHRDERTAKLEHIDTLIDYQMDRIAYDNLLDRMVRGE